MNAIIRYYDNGSFKEDFIYSKELYSLINYKISTDLKGFQLSLLEDNRILIHPENKLWVFHIRKKRGFWNKKLLENCFEHFSITDDRIKNFLFQRWVQNLLKEELSEELSNDVLLEDSSSNRTMLINQILNVSKNLTILESDSKYLTKDYWFSKPNFENLNRFNIFLD